ncbi:uncharacterized protein ATNIH1004_003805 [Aspergillus tanneri]|uniref:Major facilitator superfamily (MFS) profile domain-containing protein n=1 Tax=Aspergillus tanneri TaxID=1220188 RepID=A0A5M9MVE7_9EURO|nr:uncharacterized protein ATNIH1004_003805 [Aspergillus tanneri]KAA8651112.1 hypothetical protein ATNIH1004_003805 [Aspergillus tanneri]
MAEQNRAPADSITVIHAIEVDAGPSQEISPNESPVEAHDLPEHLKFRTKLRLAAILVAIYLVLFVAAFDQTIIATSIPTISASLHSASGYTWIGGAYLLANTAAGPLWAKCSDIWGRKLALLSGVAIFAAASIIAAMSTSMAMLITARALQGTAAGGLGQMVTITISDVFSMRNRALFLGLLGVMWAVAGSTGPLIGVHSHICGFAFALLIFFLDVHNPRTKLSDGVKAVDWFGTFSIFGVTLLLLGLDFGGAIFPWNTKYPLMLLGLFKNWSNNAAFLAASAHSMVSMGVKYYLPLYFQKATMDIIVGILIRQTGRYKEIIWAGVIIMTMGTGLFISLQTDTPIASIIGFQIASGIGIAFLFQLPMIAVQNTVSQADTATATATLGFFRNLATSLSIVLGGEVFQKSMTTRQSFLIDAGVSEPVRQALSGRQAAAHVDIGKTIQDPVQRHAVQDAFVWSIRNMLIMYTCIAGIAMIASAFMKQLKLRTEYTETKTGAQQLTK